MADYQPTAASADTGGSDGSPGDRKAPGAPDPLKAPTPRPCASCPYRRDVPSAVWAPAEYEKLIAYDRPTPEQPQRPFLCHQTIEDDPTPPHLCGGWVACHGDELLALRIAVMDDRLIGEDLDRTMQYSSPVPIFATGTDAAAHGMRDVEPSARAAAIAAKIRRRRAAVTTDPAPDALGTRTATARGTR